MGVEGWEIEAQASSRVSSAWIETSARRGLDQPSLSQEEGTGVRAAHFLGFLEVGTLPGAFGGCWVDTEWLAKER